MNRSVVVIAGLLLAMIWWITVNQYVSHSGTSSALPYESEESGERPF
jgi:hypothetical protein